MGCRAAKPHCGLRGSSRARHVLPGSIELALAAIDRIGRELSRPSQVRLHVWRRLCRVGGEAARNGGQMRKICAVLCFGIGVAFAVGAFYSLLASVTF